ncbi:hypothetical protein CGRA01v4_09770 [Colletotrichum graminicola]|nr:hypothetical protein CGRA01v4_09770 [Colletotrichum graminicola]
MLLVGKLRCIVPKVCHNLRPRLVPCTNNTIKVSPERVPTPTPSSLAPSHSSLRSNRTNGFPAHRRRTTWCQPRSRLLPRSQGLKVLHRLLRSIGRLPRSPFRRLAGSLDAERRMAGVRQSLFHLGRNHAAALRQPGLGFFAAQWHLLGLGLRHGGPSKSTLSAPLAGLGHLHAAPQQPGSKY